MRVQKVNFLRNRIAHHEPIYRLKHREYYDTILELIGLINAETHDWVKNCSTVMATVRTPPTPSTGVHGLPLTSVSLRPPPNFAANALVTAAMPVLLAARPPIGMVVDPNGNSSPLSVEMISSFVFSTAGSEGDLVDLSTYTVADVLAQVQALRIATIDSEASTGDLQALFFPQGVPQQLRPQIALITKAGLTIGVIAHPAVRYR